MMTGFVVRIWVAMAHTHIWKGPVRVEIIPRLSLNAPLPGWGYPVGVPVAFHWPVKRISTNQSRKVGHVEPDSPEPHSYLLVGQYFCVDYIRIYTYIYIYIYIYMYIKYNFTYICQKTILKSTLGVRWRILFQSTSWARVSLP